ncbi:trigger factor [Blautia sp. MSJ-19]|uniref:trigger factor n=1 Tax=Blautia sp. MSJ-19 TaxID=2841517 RepID=UPI001C0F034E|nr:trigger factor [Blautia sp. MSJ-19]MBU5482086.1 trigger factor [Blautia sp. MSJ-19]
MKKKVVAVMLVMCMAFSAAACGKAAEDNKTETAKDTEETKETSDDSKKDTKASSSETRLVSVSDVSDYITIGKYKGLTLNRVSQSVTEDDIQAEIDYELEDKGTEVKDGTVEEGDTVTINFTGTIDGKEFDGGSAEDYDLVVGDGGMIDGFEDGIIGMKKGETKELDLTFPEDYYESSVAGKDVVFEITLQKFTRPAELNDVWVKANTDYNTVDEYREAVKKQLEDSAAESADYDLYSSAWSEVLAASEIKEYPKEDVEQATETYKKFTEDYLKQADMELADFLEAQGMTEDEYNEQCQQYAESKVEQNLIVQGIMDAENLSLDSDDAQKIQDELLQEYGFTSLDEMIEAYGEQEVQESLGLLMVERYIVDQATINETTGTDGEVANEDAAGEDLELDSDEELEVTEEPGTEESEDAAAEDDSDVANEG